MPLHNFLDIRLVSFMLQLHVLVHLICRLLCRISLTYCIALELYQHDFAQVNNTFKLSQSHLTVAINSINSQLIYVVVLYRQLMLLRLHAVVHIICA